MPNCPHGSTYRKPYTRKSDSGKTVKVKGSCRKTGPERKRVDLNKELESLLNKLRKYSSTKKEEKSVKCPKGYVKRSAYYRTGYSASDRRRVSPTIVRATCIKDSKKKSLLGKFPKGALTKFGYENIKNLSVEKRRRALKKAVKEYGYLPVIKKLNSVYVLTRSTNPRLAAKFKKDQEYVSKEYNKKILKDMK